MIFLVWSALCYKEGYRYGTFWGESTDDKQSKILTLDFEEMFIKVQFTTFIGLHSKYIQNPHGLRSKQDVFT
jgi:hypothetical protein